MTDIFANLPKFVSVKEAEFQASELAQLNSDERKANAKRWGKVNGYTGASGGFIYNRDRKPVCQGWWTFFDKYRYVMLADMKAGIFRVTRARTP